ncbi:MAG: transcription-repair coupling factor [Planctomycetales bacterium]|nr:transcription-repair coupling factor [Planctomycetales bacterium]
MTTDITTKAETAGSLGELVGRLHAHDGFAEVLRLLAAGERASLDGVWGASRALVAASLAHRCPATVVVVCPTGDDIDDFCDDLRLFMPDRVEPFPAWEVEAGEERFEDAAYGDRLRVLKRLAGGVAPKLVVTSIQSLLQPVPDAAELAAESRLLAVGDMIELEDLGEWLVARGFHNTPAVRLPGEFSIRGGIVDLFAPDWEHPVRIDLFDDEIESIRQFEVESQRSLGELKTADLSVLSAGLDEHSHLSEYLPEGSWLLLVEPGELAEHGRSFYDAQLRRDLIHDVPGVMKQIARWPHVSAEGMAVGGADVTWRLPVESVERFSGDVNKVRGELEAAAGGQQVFVVCETEAEVARLTEIFGETELARQGKIQFPVGRLSQGFRLVSDRISLVGGRELFHRTDLARRSRRKLGRVIDSFLDLRENDLVVHLAHGVGRYRGLKLLEKEGQTEEHLELEFQGDTKIYVPSSRIDLVQKYVGGTKGKKHLAKIGGKVWARQKREAELACTELATEMVELQALRELRPGIAFPPDSPWQKEFDASFPYTETPDQLAAIAAIKDDMQRPQPMDRLLCGDVGFGKTEVAVRAAFKAIDAGYQVAVLVPTTVLAAQHYRSFRDRLAEFPFEIAMLSRFCSGKEERSVLERLEAGSIDLVIGTHRLAQADINFRKLGLLIIDEEQRFGVAVKERLKAARAVVDVLTLSATPIPRTLHMSLLGVRDIANLETAPADRLAIETKVTRFNDELIRNAVLREMRRGGQIFFVHNRVQDIEKVAKRLREIVPEASIGIGHGQMPGHELEEVMVAFIAGEFDILLATTIIESGLDIPNANTIFIDDADRYGLAELHQLRGRVGRYKHRAYAYLLIDKKKHLSREASRRLRAIEEYSDLGAGFAIAMRDLEIRGAGNLLGTQQSGHINNVGYELYCALLESCVRKMKKMPPKESIEVDVNLPSEAFLPESYVTDVRLKIDLYRRLSRLTNREDLADFAEELADRFGPRPQVVDRLITLAEIQILAHRWQIRAIHIEDRYIVFTYAIKRVIQKLASRDGIDLRIADEKSAYLPFDTELMKNGGVLDLVKSVLRP